MHRLMLDEYTKRVIKKFSIFFGMIFGMTVLLVTTSLFAHNSWKAGLALELQHVLDSYSAAQYTVGKNIQINSTISTSAVVYSLLKKDERKNEKYYGIIVRIPSILGPLPAVFIYNENKDVIFIDYAVDNGKASDTVRKQISNSVMRYWEDMIPKILEKAQIN